MNQARFFFALTSLAIGGYIAFPFTSTLAQTTKTVDHQQKSSKPDAKSNHSSHPTDSSQNSDDDHDDDANEEDNKNPTQSLFDAINIGDLRGARDALNRGADLRATNVLGQTPIEMSIDLNRDRITFLLLSMRGYNNSPQTLTSDGEVSSVSVKNNQGHLSIKGKNQRQTISTINKASPLPHQDGGLPKPEIGFLGFQKN